MLQRIARDQTAAVSGIHVGIGLVQTGGLRKTNPPQGRFMQRCGGE
jgi:hypothetical protein